MLFSVSLARLFGVSSGMARMAHCRMRVVSGLLVVAGLVVLGGFAMVAGRMGQMFGGLLVLFGSFLGHVISFRRGLGMRTTREQPGSRPRRSQPLG